MCRTDPGGKTPCHDNARGETLPLLSEGWRRSLGRRKYQYFDKEAVLAEAEAAAAAEDSSEFGSFLSDDDEEDDDNDGEAEGGAGGGAKVGTFKHCSPRLPPHRKPSFHITYNV